MHSHVAYAGSSIASTAQHAQQQQYCRHSTKRTATCRAAAGSTPSVSLKRFADAQGEAAVVTERRAADVAVVGSSTAAVLAAYTLAKSGRKVLLLQDYGLSAPTPRPRPLQPLKLTDPDPFLVHLSAESAAYWGGLQALSGAALLAPQRSLDLVLDPERDHPGAAGFSKLQEACAAAGVPVSLLSGSEVNSSCRQLTLPPHRAAGLLQGDGGVLRATTAAAAARQLAAKEGVLMRDGLALRGWRDRGSCFELRASSTLAPDAVSCLYEAEVLLLAPGAWSTQSLVLFGLNIEELQVRELVSSRLAVSNAEQLQQQLPLLHTWGACAPSDAPQQPEGWALLPSGAAGDGSVMLQQSAAWGVPVTSPFTWQPARFSRGREQQEEGREEADDRQQQAAASWADLQVAQLHDSCSSQVLRGLAPLTHPSTRCSTSLVSTLPDGHPLAGSHNGFDAGRVVVCCGVAGSERFGPGSASSSYQLSPMLAKLASDVVKAGGGSPATDGALLAAVSLQRQGLEVRDSLQQLDSWEGLGGLQQAARASAIQQEEQQDLARDAEQDMVGTRQ